MDVRYLWEIEFDSGQVISQNNRPKDFDPQDPLEVYGVPVKIRLVPISGGKIFEVPIPSGYKPVCHRYMKNDINGAASIMSYRIGYRNEHTRYITSIDKNGNDTELIDRC